MGVCVCNNAKNIAAASDIMVPVMQNESKSKLVFNKNNDNNNNNINDNSNDNSHQGLQMDDEVDGNDEPHQFLRPKTKKNTKNISKANNNLSSGVNDSSRDYVPKNQNGANVKEKESGHNIINCVNGTKKNSGENTNYTDQHNAKKHNKKNGQDFIEAEQENQVSIMNNTDCPYPCMNKVITKEDQKQVFSGLTSHYLFKDGKDDLINAIIEALSLYQIEADTGIFKEGEMNNNFYIIKAGKVEMKTNNKSKILVKGDSFGELSLVEPKTPKKYSISAKTEIEVYTISYDKWTQIANDVHIVNPKELEENTKIISECYIFHHLPEACRRSLSGLSKRFIFTKSPLVIISNGCSLNNKGAKISDNISKTFLGNSKLIVYVLSGELLETFHTLEVKNTIKPKEFAGIIYTILNPHEQSEYTITLPEGGTSKCGLIPENIFLETFGTNYRIEILFSLFKAKLLANEGIKTLISICEPPHNEANANEEYIYQQGFQQFSVQHYKGNDIVISHNTYDNKNYYLILNGEGIRSSNKKTYVSTGKMIGDKFIDSHSDLDYDIIARSNLTVVFEGSWKSIGRTFEKSKYNQSFFERFNNLSKINIFRDFTDSKIINYSRVAKQITAKKGELLIKEGTINNYFFGLAKGRVKMKTNTMKKLRVYDEGSCFGDYSILYDLPNVNNFVTCENSVLYTIDNNEFKELLKEPSANDFIREKMLIESTESDGSELYFLSYLGRGRFGNVCLVHNKMMFYAAKAVSKLAAEKQKTGVKNLINEKKTMVTLDHPFIVKLVKTGKKDNWCFLLQEGIPGKNFADYLDNRKSKHNVYETKFYAATMFVMISYGHKRHIVHRDIKPNNIMMDGNGYLKMIDFGTSRKLKNFCHTIIGTPNFIAPEIISGKGYSFAIDYWSIGISVYYIYYGLLPFGQKAIELLDIYREIIEMEPNFPKETPKEIRSGLSGLLNKNQAERTQSGHKIKDEYLYKDFSWDDGLRFKIKPFYLPERDDKDNPENLKITNSPFIDFMESEKFTTIQMQTLKIQNSKQIVKQVSALNTKWFEDF